MTRDLRDSLLVLTNIQSPYNAEFYSELERRTSLRVYYALRPADLGRNWLLPQRQWEYVGSRWSTEAKAVWEYRGSDVILSGDYNSLRTLMRLAVTRVSNRRYFWGERLASGGSLKRPLRRALLSGFDGVFAVGTWARASYREVVAPGVPIHVLPYASAGPSGSRQPAEKPVVGFVGSLAFRKGLDILLKALGGMKGPPRLEVVGSGPQEQLLRQQALDLNVNTSWLGELSVAETNQVRASWWLQAVPSRYDGWGVVVNEGLASGVPVLASSMTGAAHDLLDGKCGDIVWSEDAWSAAITTWLAKSLDEPVTEAAIRVARLVSARSAARWLEDVLAGATGLERDFFAEKVAMLR